MNQRNDSAAALHDELLSASEIADLLGQPQPTQEQARIIEAPLESMLIVAGAGSGKTETMSARVVWLIANGLVQPREILGLTFTRKAAGELLDRVRMRLEQLGRVHPLQTDEQDPALNELNRPTISTYNAYAASLVQEHGLRIGREPGARLLSEASQWAIVHDIVEKWQGDLDTDKAVSTITKAVLGLAGGLSEHLLSVEQAKEQIQALLDPLEDLPFGKRRRTPEKTVSELGTTLSTRYQLLDLVHEYERYKQINEAMDFGDQVALAAQLAESVPIVGELERERFKVVLLDEYQDTSYAQIRFLAALFGAGHPVTAVGDPNQSIYAWRGASAAGPARFPEQFRNRDGSPAATYALSTSWRNDHAILAAANLTAAPLYAADPKNSLPSLNARPGAGTGTVHAAYYETIEDEAEGIAQYIKERWQPGETSAAVLCRKRSQFPLLESTLRAHGIPVEVIGLGGLLATPEVVDVVAFLEAAHDPSRGDSVMRLLTGPRFNLGAADLIALGTFARNLSRGASRVANRHAQSQDAIAADETTANLQGEQPVHIDIDPFEDRSILDALAMLPESTSESASEGGSDGAHSANIPKYIARELEGISFTQAGVRRMRELNDVLEQVRSLTYLPLPELVEAAVRLLSLDVEMALATARARRAGVPYDPANPFGRAHLDALRRVAADFADSAATPTLGAFLSWLHDAVEHERGLDRPVGRPDPHAVALLTVHAAKGLEWDVVAVPGLSDGQFPSVVTRKENGASESAWLSDLGALPFSLRGDARDLPSLQYDGAVDDEQVANAIAQFKLRAGRAAVMDERRLAYVAFTRARKSLLVSGAWWRTGARKVDPSPFLSELVEGNCATILTMAEAPEEDATNPRDGVVVEAYWPFELADESTHTALDAISEAEPSSLVQSLKSLPTHLHVQSLDEAEEPLAQSAQRTEIARTLALTRLAAQLVAHTQASPQVLEMPLLTSGNLDLAELADLLLRERTQGEKVQDEVAFPAHISVSGIVDIDRDREAYALARRRPIPREPSVASRRGTTFHLWVENYFGTNSLFDLDDLPGADDDYLDHDATLEKLKSNFLSSPWAQLQPLALESDIDIVVCGVAIRARIDAVFPDPDRPGAVVVVDWKTGRAPLESAERASRELQLALYRIAWSEATGTPLEDIDAAFYYVASSETVRPQALASRTEIEKILLGA